MHALLADGRGGCHAGGRFSAPFGPIAHWTGSHWESASAGLQPSDIVYALAEFNGQLVAAGSFSRNGQHACLMMSHYDASTDGLVWETPNWSDFNHGEGYALVVYKDMLILGGSFEMNSGIRNVVGWDGLTWHNLGQGNGSNGPVHALEVYSASSDSQDLYAGGSFTNVGRTSGPSGPELERNIAKYNNQENSWEKLPTPSGEPNAPVHALHAVDEGSLKGLYIGGEFSAFGTASGFNHVARFRIIGSTNLQKLDGGTNGIVMAFCDLVDSFGERVVAGGQFTIVDGSMVVQNVASFSSSRGWREMDHGVGGAGAIDPLFPPEHGAVYALAPKSHGCYAGGDLSQCGRSEDPCSFIARYQDYSIWQPFLTPFDQEIFSPGDALGNPFGRKPGRGR